VRLNFRFRYSLYAAVSVLFLSGTIWLWTDALKDSPEGEMWQGASATLLMIHGGAAMVTLMLLGALIPLHILRGWRAGKNLVTGSIVVALNAILVATAFALYYAGSEHVRPWSSNVHLASGLLLPFVLVIHIMRGRMMELRSRHSADSTRLAKVRADASL
jgi:hypothetical protein